MYDIELTTMCAIVDKNMVLMINRKNSWKGWSFPGGHLEDGESMLECIKREIFEETGLIVKNISYMGFAHFYNTENHKRHIISNYFCNEFEGNITKMCDEGDLRWISISDILKLELSEGMEYRLPLFFSSQRKEMYVEWNEENGYSSVVYNDI